MHNKRPDPIPSSAASYLHTLWAYLAHLIALVLLILGLFFCQEISANNELVPVFELKYTSKGQPNYIIKIYRDGKVHYHGDKIMSHGVLTQQVGVIGDRYAQMTQAQLNELIIYFLSLPFEVAKKYEMKRGNEVWAKTIGYKDIYASMHMNDPAVFAVLIKRLDKLISIRQWVCLPKNRPEYNDHCIEDGLPENPDDLKYYLEH
jgi:hypothetical protein